MYFVTLDEPELMAIADRIVAELAIELASSTSSSSANTVIEINPRISTIVYQEDLNLPYPGSSSPLGCGRDLRTTSSRRCSCAGAGRAARALPGYFR
jgi:hypothetical protein